MHWQIVSAQSSYQKIKFRSVNELGLFAGQKGEALSVQTINGIKKDKSFAGVGLGLDFYGTRSIPLFAHLRRDLFSARNTPFAYGGIGESFTWLKSDLQSLQAMSKPGLYYDFGLGYKFYGKNHNSFTMSAGYSLKQVRYNIPSYRTAPTAQLQAENDERYSVLYRRLVLRFGFEL